MLIQDPNTIDAGIGMMRIRRANITQRVAKTSNRVQIKNTMPKEVLRER